MIAARVNQTEEIHNYIVEHAKIVIYLKIHSNSSSHEFIYSTLICSIYGWLGTFGEISDKINWGKLSIGDVTTKAPK